MKNPSIIVFTTQHMPTGGTESHLQEFCLNLYKVGVRIDLVVLNSKMMSETEALFKTTCSHVYLGKNKSSVGRFIWLCLTAIKLGTRRYNAVYTNGQGESILLFLKLLFLRRKWIHHHHTAGDALDQATWGNRYRKALTSANTVIACSNGNAFSLEAVLNRPVVSIPCFSRAVSVPKHVKRERLRFGYFGRLIREKGIDLLCKLSEDEDLQEIDFHIWGEGESYPAAFFARFSRLHYHGSFAGREELPSVIGSLDCFLLLSTHPEGLPISLLEAMSAGLPWLATDKGGIRDIALDQISTRIISEPLDYDKVKLAIISFASDLKAGLVSRQSQTKLYNEMFSPSAIILKWQKELRLTK